LQQLYVDRLPPIGQVQWLEGDEAHYLGRALRARPGERYRLAAADGQAAVAELLGFSQGRAELRLETLDPDPPEGLSLHLALCPPRGDAFEQALEMAVQLGVQSLRLVRSERTLAVPGQGALKLERVQKRIQEAGRQCLRAQLPELLPSLDLTAALSEPFEGLRLLCSERGGIPLAQAVSAAAKRYVLLIGPEGGFSAAELRQPAAAAWAAVSFGPRILRVPTAVAFGLAGLRALSPAMEP
jgi:16S rRNA (uracil1498-N3)-methyltransferase